MSYRGRIKCPSCMWSGAVWMNAAYIQQRNSITGKLSQVIIGYYCTDCGHFMKKKDSGMV